MEKEAAEEGVFEMVFEVRDAATGGLSRQDAPADLVAFLVGNGGKHEEKGRKSFASGKEASDYLREMIVNLAREKEKEEDPWEESEEP